MKLSTAAEMMAAGVYDLDTALAHARYFLHVNIDAAAEKAHRVIKALAERDRRGLGQLTRWDHVINRINRRNP